MRCDECGRREASIRYTEMVDGGLSTWNLCEECARARGVTGGLTSLAGPLVDILMSLLGDSEETSVSLDDQEGPVCPQCGMRYGEFRSTGRLGCGACYGSFGERLLPLIRRIHESTRHVGRVPPGFSARAGARGELRRLEAELERAVRHEEYERAAELRDLIGVKRAELERPEGEDVDV